MEDNKIFCSTNVEMRRFIIKTVKIYWMITDVTKDCYLLSTKGKSYFSIEKSLLFVETSRLFLYEFYDRDFSGSTSLYQLNFNLRLVYEMSITHRLLLIN